MNGIEKITDKILSDAAQHAGRIKSEAEAAAAAAIAEAEKAAEKIKADARAKAGKEADSIMNRARSAAALAERNRLLEAKSGLIDKAFEMAKKKLTGSAEYKTFLAAMLDRAVSDLPGEVYIMSVNKKDRAAVQEIINNRTNIKLSDSDADIEGGFILTRGDIEINCSIEILTAQLRESLESEVNRILFVN